MNVIMNLISVWENGQFFPHGWPVGSEKNSDDIGEMVSKRWNYAGNSYELSFEGTNYNRYSFDLLPDETGFIVIDGNPGRHAYILNGDASVRFVLQPAFNMRGFDAERLANIQHGDDERAKKLFRPPPMRREEQVLFYNKTKINNTLEIFGDDGFGDCYYRYNPNTGELLSTRTLPRRS